MQKPSRTSCSGYHLASDAPNAAAYKSASALLLMIFCFLVYAFKRCRPTAALNDLSDSVSSAQSESEKTVTSELVSEFENLDPLSLTLQVPNKTLQFGKAVL